MKRERERERRPFDQYENSSGCHKPPCTCSEKSRAVKAIEARPISLAMKLYP